MCNENIDCPHLANCVNANTNWCQNCQHNKNHKVNYYVAVPQPSYPYYPYYPYTPWPYTTNPYPVWTVVTNGTSANCNYYTAVKT